MRWLNVHRSIYYQIAVSLVGLLIIGVITVTSEREGLLELFFRDLLFILRWKETMDERIIVVEIDELTEQQVGGNIYNEHWGEIVDLLLKADTRTIILDRVFQDMSDVLGVDETAVNLFRTDNKVIIGCLFIGRGEGSLARTQAGEGEQTSLIFPKKPYYDPDIPGPPIGFVNMPADVDFYSRRFYLTRAHQGTTHEAMVLTGWRQFTDITDDIQVTNTTTIIGDLEIPRDNRRESDVRPTHLINFSMDQSSRVSAATILDPTFHHTDMSIFKDKIVLVGSALPAQHDTVLVPFNRWETHRPVYGVWLQAEVLHTLLSQRFLYDLPRKIAWYLTFGIAFLATLLAMVLSPGLGVICLLFIIFGYEVWAVYAFFHYHTIYPITGPFVAGLLCYAMPAIVRFVFTQTRLARLKKNFGRFVSPDVVQQLYNSDTEVTTGGETRVITMLFSDIMGFTHISEAFPPEAVVTGLNMYLSKMSKIVHEHTGTIDKFVGDQIVALFGAPLYYENHAEVACSAALAMREALSGLLVELQASGFNLPELRAGIGINTGQVIVGHMGSEDRVDYTAIGDSMNIAARIEGLTRTYNCDIIVGEATCRAAEASFEFEELGEVQVKGRERPIKVYGLVGRKT